MTNAEIEITDNLVHTIYTSKAISANDNDYSEVFIDQIKHVQNSEVMFDEYTVNMFFRKGPTMC